MTDRVLGMLGLAVRAGKVIFGSEASAKAVRQGRAFLVILACDASERTKKLIYNKCKSFNVPVVEYKTLKELGRSLGKRSVSCLALKDKGFAKAVGEKTGLVQN